MLNSNPSLANSSFNMSAKGCVADCISLESLDGTKYTTSSSSDLLDPHPTIRAIDNITADSNSNIFSFFNISLL